MKKVWIKVPWSIERRGGEYCVVKEVTGESEGCHKNRSSAIAQVKALYGSESDKNVYQLEFHGGEEAAVEHLHLALESETIVKVKDHVKEALTALGEYDAPTAVDEEEYKKYEYSEEESAVEEAAKLIEYSWGGPIVFEEVATGDNRYFRSDAITWDEETLPWAFRWQKASTQGHAGAVPIGRLDSIERKDGGIIYGKGVIIPDLNEEAAEYMRLLEAGVASGVSVDGDSAEFEILGEEGGGGKPRIEFSSMRLRSLTAVDIPAFDGARISLTSQVDELARKKKRKLMMRAYSNQENHQPLVASAIPVKPKTEWFVDPKFDGPTPITVSKDGAVTGHLAIFNSCHIAFPGSCVTPPRNSKYVYFHTGEVETEEGELVDVGHLTFNTGHASMQDNAAAAASHYDNTGTVAADVRCGEDKYGIWVAGALRSTLSDEDIRVFRAAPLSGDWRRIAGKLELIGALAVNVPGFVIPRTRVLVASGHIDSRRKELQERMINACSQ